MNWPHLLLLLSALSIFGCKKTDQQLPPAVATEITRIQEKAGLSDEQLTTALTRWIEFHSATSDLLESEDILGNTSLTPERLANLAETAEAALAASRHEDRRFAIYSLGHLHHLNNNELEKVVDSLRSIVAAHYLNTKDKPDADSDPFIQNTNELAQSDHALKFLLEASTPD